jgi:predicted Fe-S protein YdhL (DUF1289 family)
MSAPEIDYICVGICRVDPESGVCLGCGRPPPDETSAAAAESARYPVASELADCPGSACSTSLTQ